MVGKLRAVISVCREFVIAFSLDQYLLVICFRENLQEREK